jgi:hypothetical protein
VWVEHAALHFLLGYFSAKGDGNEGWTVGFAVGVKNGSFVGKGAGDSVLGGALGVGLDPPMYLSIFGGNVIVKGRRVGRFVTGKGVGIGDGDVGDVVRSTGTEVGVPVSSTPMSVGSKASEGTKVLVIHVGVLVAKV